MKKLYWIQTSLVSKALMIHRGLLLSNFPIHLKKKILKITNELGKGPTLILQNKEIDDNNTWPNESETVVTLSLVVCEKSSHITSVTFSESILD